MALANNKSSHSYSASICFNDFVTGLMSRKNLFFVYYSLYFRRVRKLTLAQIYRKRKHREEEYKGRGMERASKIVNKLPTSLQCNSDGQTNKQAPTHLTRYHLTERERGVHPRGRVSHRVTAGRRYAWHCRPTSGGHVVVRRGHRQRKGSHITGTKGPQCHVRCEVSMLSQAWVCIKCVCVRAHTCMCVCEVNVAALTGATQGHRARFACFLYKRQMTMVGNWRRVVYSFLCGGKTGRVARFKKNQNRYNTVDQVIASYIKPARWNISLFCCCLSVCVWRVHRCTSLCCAVKLA